MPHENIEILVWLLDQLEITHAINLNIWKTKKKRKLLRKPHIEFIYWLPMHFLFEVPWWYYIHERRETPLYHFCTLQLYIHYLSKEEYLPIPVYLNTWNLSNDINTFFSVGEIRIIIENMHWTHHEVFMLFMKCRLQAEKRSFLATL